MTAQCGRRCLPSCFRPMKGDLFETVMEERTKSSRQHPMRPPMGLTMSVPDTHTLQRDAVSKPLSVEPLETIPLFLMIEPTPSKPSHSFLAPAPRTNHDSHSR